VAFKTITVKDFTECRKELKATAVAITPGMLVERTSGNLVQAHSNAGKNATPMFAVEDDLQGKEIGDNYAVSAQVQVNWFRTGDEVYAILNDGENVSIGDELESAGNGKLQAHGTDSAGEEHVEALVCRALEAVDMSDSSAADPTGRILVEII
jgi:hypothetical protein